MQRKYGHSGENNPQCQLQNHQPHYLPPRPNHQTLTSPPSTTIKRSFITHNCQFSKIYNFNSIAPITTHPPFSTSAKNSSMTKSMIFSSHNSPHHPPESQKKMEFQNVQPPLSFTMHPSNTIQYAPNHQRTQIMKKSEIFQPNHHASMTKIPEFVKKTSRDTSPILPTQPATIQFKKPPTPTKFTLNQMANQPNKHKLLQSVIIEDNPIKKQKSQNQSLNKSGTQRTSTQSSETNKDNLHTNKIKRPTIWPMTVQPFEKKSHEELMFRKQKQTQIQQENYQFQARNRLSAPLPTRQKKQFKLDDFQVIEKIGKGAYGDVFLAQQKKTSFLCVIKTISKLKIKEQKLQQHIFREIKLQLYMNHKHITPLFGFFHDQNKIYLILQYLTDGNLSHVYRKKKLPQPKTSSIARQVCQGLSYMHRQNILHRDIKPQNLFIHQDYIKIGDFGCAVFSNTLRSTVVGCLAYISPQQLSNCEYDEKIDVWSLGILTYELLTGKPPFQEDIIKIAKHQKQPKLSQLIFPQNIHLSKQAVDFVSKLLRENPDERMDLRSALKHPFITKYKELEVNKMR